MQILYFGKGNFKIKSKKASIDIGEICKINDFVIPGKGEFEAADVRLEWTNNLLIFDIDNFSLAYLGKRKTPLEKSEISELEDIDILFIPVGADDVFNVKDAQKIINDLEPKIVIPMYYNKDFDFNHLNGAKPEILDELKLKPGFKDEELKRIVILNAKSK